MSQRTEICLCARGEDRHWYFDDDDVVHPFNPRIDYGHLLCLAGVFQSITAAHENGFAGQVPLGWSTVHWRQYDIHIANKNWVSTDG